MTFIDFYHAELALSRQPLVDGLNIIMDGMDALKMRLRSGGDPIAYADLEQARMYAQDCQFKSAAQCLTEGFAKV